MWFWFALLSAVLGAIEIIVNKKALSNVSPALLTWALVTLNVPFFIVLVLIEGKFTLHPVFLFSAFSSSTLYIVGKTLQNSSLQKGVVSKIFPLSAFSGLFVYVFGLLFLDEHIALLPLTGLLLLVIGSYVLNAEEAKENLLKPFTILFTNRESLLYLFSLLLVSVTGVFDKTAIKHSTPAMTLLTENIFMVALLTPYLMKREKGWTWSFRKNYKILSFNSFIFGIMSLLIFFAIADGPLALVVGVKRVQIFFVLILSIWLLKERVHKLAWIASIFLALGVILIRIG